MILGVGCGDIVGPESRLGSMPDRIFGKGTDAWTVCIDGFPGIRVGEGHLVGCYAYGLPVSCVELLDTVGQITIQSVVDPW